MDRPAQQRWNSKEVARLINIFEAERRFLDELVTTLPAPIATVNASGLLLSANRGFMREFGLTRDDLEGRSVGTLIGLDGLPQLLSPHGESHAKTERYEIKVTPLQRWEQAETEWSVLLSPLLPQAAAVPDVPASPVQPPQLEAEWQCNAAAVRAIQRLAARVTHEANNLIMIAAGYGREILNGLPPDSPLRDDVGLLLEATQRMEEIAGQLSDYSRPNGVSPVPSRLQDLLPADGYRIVSAVPEVSVIADKPAIQFAFATFSRMAGGSLTLAINHISEHIVLSLGPLPFSMEALAENLEPLNKAARENRESARNAALICSRLVRGGAEWRIVEPATFEIRLPLAANAPATGPSQPQIALVVDDQPGIRNIVRRLLESKGFRVLEAGSAEEALSLLQRRGESPNLLVTDMRMGGMSGRDLAERVRQQFPSTRILFISGYTDDPAVQAGLLPENALFLAKPFHPEQFVAAVKRLMNL